MSSPRSIEGPRTGRKPGPKASSRSLRIPLPVSLQPAQAEWFDEASALLETSRSHIARDAMESYYPDYPSRRDRFYPLSAIGEDEMPSEFGAEQEGGRAKMSLAVNAEQSAFVARELTRERREARDASISASYLILRAVAAKHPSFPFAERTDHDREKGVGVA